MQFRILLLSITLLGGVLFLSGCATMSRIPLSKEKRPSIKSGKMVLTTYQKKLLPESAVQPDNTNYAVSTMTSPSFMNASTGAVLAGGASRRNARKLNRKWNL